MLGRVTGADVFSVASRRGDDPNRFDGVILVGVSPAYFRSFDRDMFGGDTDYSASLIRDDGTLLASYPDEVQSGREPQRDKFLADAIARMPQVGVARGRSVSDDTDRLIAYRRLAAYPVYVTVGRKWGSILREWGGLMATHLVFGIPATLALFALSYLAMRQAQRQNDTLATLRDEVRRREGAEEALRQSQKMEAVGRLTGGIAHDFNNHLTVISSNIELLQRRLPSNSESLVRLSNSAMMGVQRAATLTHRLLAFSRQQPLDPEALDLGRLVSNISALLRQTLGESVAVETVLAGGLWLTRVDANQLESALLNLAVNARDAMPNGGNLTIETANAYLDEAYAASHAEVDRGAVRDACGHRYRDRHDAGGHQQGVRSVLHHQAAGAGHRAWPFDGVRFREAVRRTRSDPQRTGTGQHRERSICRASCRQETGRPAKARTTTDPQPRGRGETILVVEDDEAVRRSSVEALREMGYQVLESGDAMEGVRLIVDRGGIDLLFTDVGLPGRRQRADAGGCGTQRAAGAARVVHHRLYAQRHRAQGPHWIATCISSPSRSVLLHWPSRSAKCWRRREMPKSGFTARPRT